MVLSCLVEPLVPPLVGRGTDAAPGRRSKSYLSRSRLASTALALSAVLATGTSAQAEDLLEGRVAPEPVHIHKHAHKKPDPIPYRVMFEAVALVAQRERLPMAALHRAPDFEWDAVLAHRLKHSRDIARMPGPCLGHGTWLDRLATPDDTTFLLFSSGQHQSGLAPRSC